MFNKSNNLLEKAVNYHKRGEFNKARELYETILKETPNNSDVVHFLGILFYQTNEFDLAIESISKAISLKPFFGYYLNLGLVYKAKKLTTKAKEAYLKAIELNPNFPEAYNNLANLFQESGELNEAIKNYKKAIELNPNYFEAYNNLATLFFKLENFKSSLSLYERAINLNPNYFEAYNNLGNLLFKMKFFEKAKIAFEKAIELNPNFAEAYNNLANIYKRASDFEKALVLYSKALDLEPNLTETKSALIELELAVCDWSRVDKIREELIEPILKNEKLFIEPFVLFGLPIEVDPKEQYILMQRYSKNIFADIQNIIESSNFSYKPSSDRIKIGYISCTIGNNATMHLAGGLFKRHDRDKFEVYLYSIDHEESNKYLQKVSKEVEHFVDLRGVSFLEASKKINSDGVEILIDLNGYNDNSKSTILALKPALIQINFLGFPGTMGSEFMDYIIVDKVLTPPNYQSCFSEKFLYMPDSYQVTDSEQEIAKIPTKAECGLVEDAFIFCSFNNTYKIEPKIFEIWMNILKRVENSILWLYVPSELSVKNLKKEAIKRGIDSNRLIFAKKIDKDKHLARLKLADLMLDTYYCNAHTTATDALLAEVPLITCTGKNFVARVATSLLSAIDLHECIVYDLNEYEELAVELAKNQDKLKVLKDKLKRNRLTTALFDTDKYVKELEKIYERIYKERFDLSK